MSASTRLVPVIVAVALVASGCTMLTGDASATPTPTLNPGQRVALALAARSSASAAAIAAGAPQTVATPPSAAPAAPAPLITTAPPAAPAATIAPASAPPAATAAPYYGIQEILVRYGYAQLAITPGIVASLGTARSAGSYGGQAADGSGCTATETYLGSFVGYGLVTQTGSTWVFTFPIQTGTTNGVVTPIQPAPGKTVITVHCAWFQPLTVNRTTSFTK